MDLDFLKLLMDKTGFPEEAKKEALRSAGTLIQAGQEEALDGAVDFFMSKTWTRS